MTFATPYSATVNLLHQKNPSWAAPLLWKSEYLNVLSVYYRQRHIDLQDALAALDVAERLIGPREHSVAAKAVMDAVAASSCSAYDCEFVVLAEQLETKMITHDAKVIRDFPGIAITPEEYLAE